MTEVVDKRIQINKALKKTKTKWQIYSKRWTSLTLLREKERILTDSNSLASGERSLMSKSRRQKIDFEFS
jgi:hypothetical protein